MTATAITGTRLTIEDLHPSYIMDENGEKTSVILPLNVLQQLLDKMTRMNEEQELRKLLEESKDTTEYLLSSPKNKEILLRSLADARAGKASQAELIEK